jgi:cell shape-determining protein MreC
LNRSIAELDNRLKLILGEEDYVVKLPPDSKGTVITVDPKWNFVVIDLGSDKGMLEGGVLMVHRNSKLVGKVRIQQVMANRSVANLMAGWKLGDIEEGDQVLY